MSDETTLALCPFCGGEAHIEKYCDMCSTEIDFKCARDKSPDAICAIGEEVFWVEHKCELLSNDEELHVGCFTSAREAIDAWNARATYGTLTAEQVRETVLKHGKPRFYGDWKEIADELNAMLGGKVER
jgi:hypothetical protein